MVNATGENTSLIKACIAILLTAGWRKWRAVRRPHRADITLSRSEDNPGAAATPSRAVVMRGNRAAISDADGHTGGGKGIPRAFMRITTITRLPRSIARHSLRQQGADTYSRGTDGANPSSSSGEPFCEPGSSTEAHHAGTEGSNPASSSRQSGLSPEFACHRREAAGRG